MNNIYKIVGAIIVLFGAAWGAYAGLNTLYTPREVTEMMIAQVQQNQMTLNKQFQIQNAQQWYWYWQMQVELYTGLCAREPYNTNAKQQLNEAKRMRDTWQKKVNKLMQ